MNAGDSILGSPIVVAFEFEGFGPSIALDDVSLCANIVTTT